MGSLAAEDPRLEGSHSLAAGIDPGENEIRPCRVLILRPWPVAGNYQNTPLSFSEYRIPSQVNVAGDFTQPIDIQRRGI